MEAPTVFDVMSRAADTTGRMLLISGKPSVMDPMKFPKLSVFADVAVVEAKLPVDIEAERLPSAFGEGLLLSSKSLRVRVSDASSSFFICSIDP